MCRTTHIRDDSDVDIYDFLYNSRVNIYMKYASTMTEEASLCETTDNNNSSSSRAYTDYSIRCCRIVFWSFYVRVQVTRVCVCASILITHIRYRLGLRRTVSTYNTSDARASIALDKWVVFYYSAAAHLLFKEPGWVWYIKLYTCIIKSPSPQSILCISKYISIY